MDEELINIGITSLYNGIEGKFKLPSGFLNNLLFEDDWSLIIKLHSLIEGAVSHLLKCYFHAPEDCEIFDRLEMSNKNIGKYAFLKDFCLLDNRHRCYISTLSELRNKLIHNPNNISFSLDSSIKDPKVLKNYSKAFCISNDTTSEDSVDNRFAQNPKLELWLGGLEILFVCWNKSNFIDLRKDFAEISKSLNFKYEHHEDFVKRFIDSNIYIQQ